ncbi:MAG: helix-turn-helix domain-containing protein [Flavobacteriaceae bacterium]
MKVQLESITSRVNRSFNLLFNPRLSDLFFWHFHPEYELIYIAGATGTRHVGEHISTYIHSDLVLIGSNIPHLNFDYGVQSDYQKVVIHFKKEFVEGHLAGIPELLGIDGLFKRAAHGVAFTGGNKDVLGERIFALEHLPPFGQYVELLAILQEMAAQKEFELLHGAPFPVRFRSREQERLQAIYAYVDKNYHRKITLDEISGVSNLGREAFCRYFKNKTQYTFVEFLNRYRVSHSKRDLMAGKSVGAACFGTGFESLSYFNRTFKKITGENPSEFRKKYVKTP